MSKKGSFVFYTSVWPQLFKMLENDEERGQLIMAIIDYVSFETLPSDNHSRAFVGAFEIMREQIDKDADRWQQTIQSRSENGKKGGLAKASNAKQNLANASKCYQTLATPSNAKQNLANLAVNDNDNVNDNEVISNDITKGAKTRKRFIKPTVEEVREYCQERGNTVDPDTFVNFYESKGWVVGKSPMKDWKAAVRNWERSRTETTPQEKAVGDLGNSFDTDDFWQAALADSARKRKELGG